MREHQKIQGFFDCMAFCTCTEDSRKGKTCKDLARELAIGGGRKSNGSAQKKFRQYVEKKMASLTVGEFVTESDVSLVLHTHGEAVDIEYLGQLPIGDESADLIPGLLHMYLTWSRTDKFSPRKES